MNCDDREAGLLTCGLEYPVRISAILQEIRGFAEVRGPSGPKLGFYFD
jgi:hypothetical protein